MTEIPLNRLAQVYLKIRAAEQALTQEYDAKIEKLETQKKELQSAMTAKLLAENCTSMKTDAGLVVLSTKTRYWTSDWEQFYSFIKHHDALELLERRVAQGNMKKFLEDNPDEKPPGLNADTEYQISVRKPK